MSRVIIENENQRVKVIPSGTKELIFKLKGSLPVLNDDLEVLICDDVYHLTNLLPNSLLHLSCRSAIKLPRALPPKLQFLDCEKISYFDDELVLPPTLLYLHCNSMMRLDTKLPSGLKYLSCNSVSKLPKHLYEGLEHLMINNVIHVDFNAIPNTLKVLHCNNVVDLCVKNMKQLEELECLSAKGIKVISNSIKTILCNTNTDIPDVFADVTINRLTPSFIEEFLDYKVYA